MSHSLLPPAAVFGLGGTELIVILMIVLLLFGGAKLPALAKGLGESIREFKKAARDDNGDEKSEKKTDSAPKPGNN